MKSLLIFGIILILHMTYFIKDALLKRSYGLSFNGGCPDYEKVFNCTTNCKGLGYGVYRLNRKCQCRCYEFMNSTKKIPYRKTPKTFSPGIYDIVGTFSVPYYLAAITASNTSTITKSPCVTEKSTTNSATVTGINIKKKETVEDNIGNEGKTEKSVTEENILTVAPAPASVPATALNNNKTEIIKSNMENENKTEKAASKVENREKNKAGQTENISTIAQYTPASVPVAATNNDKKEPVENNVKNEDKIEKTVSKVENGEKNETRQTVTEKNILTVAQDTPASMTTTATNNNIKETLNNNAGNEDKIDKAVIKEEKGEEKKDGQTVTEENILTVAQDTPASITATATNNDKKETVENNVNNEDKIEKAVTKVENREKNEARQTVTEENILTVAQDTTASITTTATNNDKKEILKNDVGNEDKIEEKEEENIPMGAQNKTTSVPGKEIEAVKK